MSVKEKKLGYFFYPAYFVLVSLCFIYLLFPEQAVKNHLEKLTGSILPDAEAKVGKISPGLFPPALDIDSIDVVSPENFLVRLDFLRIYPHFSSFFSLQNPSFDFHGKIFEGTIEGRFTRSFRENIPEQKLEADFRGLTLSGIENLIKHAPVGISGTLDGHAAWTSGRQEKAEAKFSLSKGQIDMTDKYLGPIMVNFDKIDSLISMNDTALEVVKCHLQGEDVELSLSGNILAGWPIMDSDVHFTGYINPHHSFLKKPGNKIVANFFPHRKTGGQGFSFTINGSVDKPSFFWK